jgi:phosphatidate cytidylyltransferase
VYLGGWPFALLGFFWAVMSLIEFCSMGNTRGIPGNVIVGIAAVIGLILTHMSGQYVLMLLIFAAVVVVTFMVEMIRKSPASSRLGRVGITAAAVAYAGFPAAFLIAVRDRSDGLVWLLLIICVTWGTDTLAYLGGRWWGKTPLAPRISPKKTLEGALTGITFGLAAGIVVLLLSSKFTPATLALVLLLPPVAVIGDLFESRMKRFFHAGDSHIAGLNLIPGHGGVLDRTDSLVWVGTVCYAYLLFVA